MYILRFDMRAPNDDRSSIVERYRSANEMVSWAENNGCLAAMLSEHHASPDNYLPSPLLLATSFASVTSSLPIAIAVVLLNMYDPIKLAEDMAVLDILSDGRVSYIIGLGYRPEEYQMFGVSMANRAQVIEEKIDALLQALSGQQFEYQGRTVKVSPAAQLTSQIAMGYGGHSKAAARRAGKFGFDFYANGGSSDLIDIYKQAAIAAGHEPGVAVIPEPEAAQCVFIAEDLDRAWKEVGPHILHDIKMYREWEGDDRTAISSLATTIQEVRDQKGAYRIVTPQQALDMIASDGPLMMSPLVGGCPPRYGWDSLKLMAEKVLPQLQ